MRQLQTNAGNLGSLGVSFGFLAKAPADMLSQRSDQLGCLDVVCGSSMWRAASTSRGSAKRPSSQCQVGNAKGYVLIPDPRIPTAEVPQ
jgi:hypothetical protein